MRNLVFVLFRYFHKGCIRTCQYEECGKLCKCYFGKISPSQCAGCSLYWDFWGVVGLCICWVSQNSRHWCLEGIYLFIWFKGLRWICQKCSYPPKITTSSLALAKIWQPVYVAPCTLWGQKKKLLKKKLQMFLSNWSASCSWRNHSWCGEGPITRLRLTHAPSFLCSASPSRKHSIFAALYKKSTQLW